MVLSDGIAESFLHSGFFFGIVRGESGTLDRHFEAVVGLEDRSAEKASCLN